MAANVLIQYLGGEGRITIISRPAWVTEDPCQRTERRKEKLDASYHFIMICSILHLSLNAPPQLLLLFALIHTCFLTVALSTKTKFFVVVHDMRSLDVLGYHIAFSKIAVIPLAKERRGLLNAM